MEDNNKTIDNIQLISGISHTPIDMVDGLCSTIISNTHSNGVYVIDDTNKINIITNDVITKDNKSQQIESKSSLTTNIKSTSTDTETDNDNINIIDNKINQIGIDSDNKKIDSDNKRIGDGVSAIDNKHSNGNSNRPFKNIIQLFPQKIQDGILDLASKGYGGIPIRRWIQDNYSGEITIPHPDTIDSYIKHYMNNQSEFADTDTKIAVIKQEIDDTERELQKANDKVGSSNGREVLENLANKCINRVSAIEKLIGTRPIPGLELLLQRYVSQIKDIVVSLAELKEELKTPEDMIPVDEMRFKLEQFMLIYSSVTRELAPEKYELIKSEINKRLKVLKESEEQE